MQLSRRLFLPLLTVVALALSACSVAPLKLAAEYRGPKPLPAELAERFSYKPAKAEPRLETLEDEDDFTHFQGTYDTKYEGIHHQAADTIDRVDARQLAVGAAVVAATAYAIADAPGRVAPRLDRRAVEQMRKKGGRP